MTTRDSLVRAHSRGSLKRWGSRLVVLAAALIALWLLFGVTVRIATTGMWFDSVRHGAVYTTMLRAQILLFCVFGALAGLVGGLTLLALRRIPSLEISSDDDTFRWLFRRFEARVRWLFVALAVLIPAILVGQRAAQNWQTYLLWRHAAPWHSTDPLFHKDVSFFVEVYPFHKLVAALLSQSLTYGLWITVIGGYWYGAWRLRRGRRKVSTGFTVLLSLLLGGFLAVHAVIYWLARYALTTSARGPVTGAGYTDVHAALPGKDVLTVVATLCALALFANAVLAGRGRSFGPFRPGRVRVIAGTLAVMLAASVVAGSAWPALHYHFREAPSAAKVDLGEIAHNQQATMAAFGLDHDITTVPYNPARSTAGTDLVQLAGRTAQASLIDPNELSPTFNVEQQFQGYYRFKSTLDVGHYVLNGHPQDVALAARELRVSGIPHPTWVNTHLEYTHGYGVVAAPTTEVDPKTQSPAYLNGGMPPQQQIPVTRPEIYFGPAFGASSYAIVGQPAGSHEQLEFDHPGGAGSPTARTTYQGHGGIAIGSALRRFLFAVRMSDPNILLSSEVNSASQLLTVRDPRARVARVAPWLTLDGDEYPAVVNGRVEWIVDGYTTATTYPDAQLVNLHTASRTTLTAYGAPVAQPSGQVNYLHNSVKAVVDAYSGTVTLYAWDQARHLDPLLAGWESVFPGLVQPESAIPSALLPQLRYPTDLFNVQRYLVASYHVTQPTNFYSGNDFWKVPSDPTVAGAPLPSKYMSMSSDGFGAPHYTLSSPMVTLNGQQLAAFVSVNSEPGPDYGKFTVLTFSSTVAGESPAQVQNDIESNTAITKALTLQRGGNSKVVLGDLEAIPLAGRMLYVEPVYTQSSGGASFPILRHVIALYGNGDPSFDTTLTAAVRDAIESATAKG